MSSTKTKKKQYVDTNPIEAFKDIGSSFSDQASDFGKGAVSDFWEQMLGAKKEKSSEFAGDLSAGEELDLAALSQKQQKEAKTQEIEGGINYRQEILHGEKKIAAENFQTMQDQLAQIIAELKRLANSSKVLEVEFKEVTIDQRITKPGKYHVTFFQWVLTVIRSARMRVENSGAWLAQFKSKKKQRGYWEMFKKHGTTFGLSNERVVSTQTG